MESRLKKLVVARSRRHTVVKPSSGSRVDDGAGDPDGGGGGGGSSAMDSGCSGVPNNRMSKSSCDLSDLSKSKYKGTASSGGGDGGGSSGGGRTGGAKVRSSSRGRLFSFGKSFLSGSHSSAALTASNSQSGSNNATNHSSCTDNGGSHSRKRSGVSPVDSRQPSSAAPSATVGAVGDTAAGGAAVSTGSGGRRSSSGGGGNPSPPFEVPQDASRRLAKAMRVKLYLLQQPGPNSFLVGDDNLASKYRVIIGPQTCSCGRGPPNCVHILFVMLRVFKLKQNDPLVWSRDLKNYEVEGLFQNYHDREKAKCKKRPSFRDSRSTTASVDEVVHKDECFIEDEDQNTCSICLLEMTVSDSLVQCQFGCQNYFHHHCLMIWFEERNAHGDPLICPLCRTQWPANRKNLCAVSGEINVDFVVDSFSDTESIPESHKETSKCWISVFGDSTVKFLFSSRSSQRELGLKFVNDLVVSRLTELRASDRPPDPDQLQVFAPTISVLLHACKDEEYKVFYAAMTLMRNLFAHLPCSRRYYSRLQTSVRPLVDTLLNRCSDRHQRVTQLALFNLVELAKNHAGCLAIGSAFRANPTASAPVPGVGDVGVGGGGGGVCGGIGGCRGGSGHPGEPGPWGVLFLLECIVSEYCLSRVSWQWLLGRLLLLDRLLDSFPGHFTVHETSCQARIRLFGILRFAVTALNSQQPRISKMAGRVFVLGARQVAHLNDCALEAERLVRSIEDASVRQKMLRRLELIRSEFSAVYRHMNHRLALGQPEPAYDLPRPPAQQQQQQQQQRHHRHASSSDAAPPLPPPRTVSRQNSSSVRPQPPPPPFPPPPPPPSQPTALAQQQQQQQQLPALPPQRPSTAPVGSGGSAMIDDTSSEADQQQRGADVDAEGAEVEEDLISFSVQVCRHFTNQDYTPEIFCAKSGGRRQTERRQQLMQQQQQQTPPPQPLPDPEPSPTPSSSTCGGGGGGGSVDHVVSSHHHHHQSDTNSWLYGWSEELPVIPGLTPSPHLVTKTAYSEGEHWVRGAQIGIGAFSTCYQARDKRTGVLMAVKEVSLVRSCDQEQRDVIEAVQEEVELMTRLRHPNLVRILGASRTRDRFCLFVEWMPGGSVSALLNRFGPFSEPVISSYIQQVLRGLAYLHNQQILHRDLKGANLLVSSSGRQVRIADFGAAGRLASHMTGAGEFKGQLLGTIAFMAPEVLRGENYGRSCDIWSVGCVIIEMVTTKPPWDMPDLSNHLALIYLIASASGPPPLPDNLHPGLRDVLLRCVDPKPFNRPSAKELLQHPLFTHYPAITARPEGRRV